MKTLILGATGYVGGTLAERLVQDGHDVQGLAHDDAAEARLRAAGHDTLGATLADVDALAAGAQGADAVVWSLNVDPPLIPQLPGVAAALVDALSGSGKPFVYLSAASLYADTGDGAADEDAPFADMPMIDLAKGLEQTVLGGAERGVRSVVVRPAMAYGRGGGAYVRGPVEQARANGAAMYIGAGEARMSSVHIDDLVDLLARALVDAPAGTVLNAAAGAPVTTKELAEATARAAGVAATFSMDPAQAAQMLGYLAIILSKNTVISADRARTLLGWEPARPSIIEELTTGSYVSTPV